MCFCLCHYTDSLLQIVRPMRFTSLNVWIYHYFVMSCFSGNTLYKIDCCLYFDYCFLDLCSFVYFLHEQILMTLFLDLCSRLLHT